MRHLLELRSCDSCARTVLATLCWLFLSGQIVNKNANYESFAAGIPVPPIQRALSKTIQDHKSFKVSGVQGIFTSAEITDPSDTHFGLRFVSISIKPENYRLRVLRIGEEGMPQEILTRIIDKSKTVAVINGGYFGIRDNNALYPLGLLIHNGHQTNIRHPWNTGGVLISTKNEEVKIIPIVEFKDNEEWTEGIQSKPMLVENSRLGIRSDDHQLANRTAIGIRDDGTLVLAGAFEPTGRAISLFEFAEFLQLSPQNGGVGVLSALNMDGGPGSMIDCPPLNLHFGARDREYVPDLVVVEAQ